MVLPCRSRRPVTLPVGVQNWGSAPLPWVTLASASTAVTTASRRGGPHEVRHRGELACPSGPAPRSGGPSWRERGGRTRRHGGSPRVRHRAGAHRRAGSSADRSPPTGSAGSPWPTGAGCRARSTAGRPNKRLGPGFALTDRHPGNVQTMPWPAFGQGNCQFMAMSMREQYEKEIVVRNPANGDGSCGLPSLPCEPVPRLLSFSLLCLGAILTP
jgi:hypothetical protein